MHCKKLFICLLALFYLPCYASPNSNSHKEVKATGLTHIYVANTLGFNTYDCVLDADGSFTNCNTVKAAEQLSEPSDVAVNKNFAYIIDFKNNGVSYCAIESSTGTITQCKKAVADFTFSTPKRILINNNTAYILDDHGISSCKINSDGSFINNTCQNIWNPTQQLFDFAINQINSTTYLYSTSVGQVTYCKLDSSKQIIEVNTCKNMLPDTVNPTIHINAIGINNNHAYLGLTETEKVASCDINSDGSLGSCNQMADINFPTPTKISFIHQKMYVVSSTQNYIIQCSLDDHGTPQNCGIINAGLMDTAGMVATNDHAYVTDAGSNLVHYCKLNQDGGIGNCILTTKGLYFNQPNGITLSNGYAYVTNYLGRNVVYCKINQDGTFDNCNSISSRELGIQSPYTLAATKNGAIYIADGTNSLTHCQIGDDGGLTQCAKTDSIFGIVTGFALTNDNHIYVGNLFADNNIMNGNIYYCQLTTTGNVSNCVKTAEGIFHDKYLPYSLSINPAGNNLYIASNILSAIGICKVDNNGLLTQCDQATNFPNLSYGSISPYQVVLHDNYAYVTNLNGSQISYFSIDNDGKFINEKESNPPDVFDRMMGIDSWSFK